MTESEITRQILAGWGAHPRLRLTRVNTGVGWFRNGQPARKTDPGAYPVKFGLRGTADLVGIIAPSGRMLMIEVKTATGKQSPAQLTMQRVVTQWGGLYIVARDVRDVDLALAQIGITR